MAGDAIPSEPARQVTAEDNAERDKREAEKNATKASLNLQATAGPTAAPTASEASSNHTCCSYFGPAKAEQTYVHQSWQLQCPLHDYEYLHLQLGKRT